MKENVSEYEKQEEGKERMRDLVDMKKMKKGEKKMRGRMMEKCDK